jgi:energy-converting hydrogenase A subunit M
MEHDRRKELKRLYKDSQVQNFVNSLPMKIEKFKELFDFIDNSDLENSDSNFEKTIEFCQTNKFDSDLIIDWIIENGAGNDSEVLYNIEEKFENL